MVNVKSVLAALLVCAGIATFAVEPRARIDVDGIRKKVKLTPKQKPNKGYVGNAGWAKKNKPYYLYSQGPNVTGKEWQDYIVSFTPENDGEVVIKLMGLYYKPKGEKKNQPVWIFFDDVVVEGADLVNGDFEQVDKNGKPKGWYIRNKKNFIQKDGKKYVKVWHNESVGQTVKVKKGQKVTIKAKVKKPE